MFSFDNKICRKIRYFLLDGAEIVKVKYNQKWFCK
jgi:hypothetical protein